MEGGLTNEEAVNCLRKLEGELARKLRRGEYEMGPARVFAGYQERYLGRGLVRRGVI